MRKTTAEEKLATDDRGSYLLHYRADASLLQTRAVHGSIVVACQKYNSTGSDHSRVRSDTVRPMERECPLLRHSVESAAETDNTLYTGKLTG